jgi:hypothetical protein
MPYQSDTMKTLCQDVLYVLRQLHLSPIGACDLQGGSLRSCFCTEALLRFVALQCLTCDSSSLACRTRN